MEYLGADCALCVYLAPGARMTRVDGWTVEGDALRDAHLRVSHFLVRQVVSGGGVVLVQDARKDRRWRSEAAQRSQRCVRALAGVPILHGTDPVAVFCFSHDTLPLVCEPGEQAPQLVAQLVAPSLGRPTLPEKPVLPVTPTAAETIEEFAWHGFHTRAAILRAQLELAARLAPSALPVMIVGENGTGRDRLAQAMHDASGRAGGCVTAGLGAIPASLAEAELFGHVRGAFTGAEHARQGLIAQAERGTLYLADIQDAADNVQAALLRVLAEGVIRPLGSATPFAVQFRLLTSSTIDPETLKARGVLREDLLHRVAGAVVRLPPLRGRPQDIGVLFQRLLHRHGGAQPPLVTAEAEQRLRLHAWPGNERELENEARRLCALGVTEIRPEDLSFTAAEAPGTHADHVVLPLAEAVRAAEKDQIVRALAAARGNKSEAARLLGITRRSLYRRIAQYGL